MDSKTGEIKTFASGEKIPSEWVLIPPIGTEVKIMFRKKLKGGVNTTRKLRGVVIDVQDGSPGRLVIEMLPINPDVPFTAKKYLDAIKEGE